jgi:hypothetical protein
MKKKIISLALVFVAATVCMEKDTQKEVPFYAWDTLCEEYRKNQPREKIESLQNLCMCVLEKSLTKEAYEKLSCDIKEKIMWHVWNASPDNCPAWVRDEIINAHAWEQCKNVPFQNKTPTHLVFSPDAKYLLCFFKKLGAQLYDGGIFDVEKETYKDFHIDGKIVAGIWASDDEKTIIVGIKEDGNVSYAQEYCIDEHKEICKKRKIDLLPFACDYLSMGNIKFFVKTGMLMCLQKPWKLLYVDNVMDPDINWKCLDHFACKEKAGPYDTCIALQGGANRILTIQKEGFMMSQRSKEIYIWDTATAALLSRIRMIPNRVPLESPFRMVYVIAQDQMQMHHVHVAYGDYSDIGNNKKNMWLKYGTIDLADAQKPKIVFNKEYKKLLENVGCWRYPYSVAAIGGGPGVIISLSNEYESKSESESREYEYIAWHYWDVTHNGIVPLENGRCKSRLCSIRVISPNMRALLYTEKDNPNLCILKKVENKKTEKEKIYAPLPQN